MGKPQFFDVSGFRDLNYVFPNTNRRENIPENSVDDIRQILKMRPGLTAIRHIAIQGSSSYGTYNIIFDEDNRISGVVAPNGIVNDWATYIIDNQGHDFDIITSNCSISSLIADFTENPNKIPLEDLNFIAGDATVYDDDYSTYIEKTNVYDAEITHITFDIPKNLAGVGVKYYVYLGGGGTPLSGAYYLEVHSAITGEWSSVITRGAPDPGQIFYDSDFTLYEGVDEIRTRIYGNDDWLDGRDYEFDLIEDDSYYYDPALFWDISTASLVQTIPPQDMGARSIFFKPDGMKMYESGKDAKKIYESSLTTPWDISTASLVQSIPTQEVVSLGIFFKSDGTKMYELGNETGKIYESTLTTPWDISTASLVQSIPGQEVFSSGIYFSPDGTKMYESGLSTDKIYESSLTTPWDISSASLVQSIPTQSIKTREVFFSPDGVKMYELGSETYKIYEHTLTTPWDISTASLVQSKPIQIDAPPTGLFFNPDGVKMYIISDENMGIDMICQYDVGKISRR